MQGGDFIFKNCDNVLNQISCNFLQDRADDGTSALSLLNFNSYECLVLQSRKGKKVGKEEGRKEDRKNGSGVDYRYGCLNESYFVCFPNKYDIFINVGYHRL